MDEGICRFRLVAATPPRSNSSLSQPSTRPHGCVSHPVVVQHVSAINYQDLEVSVVNTTATLLLLVGRAAPGRLDFKQMSPSGGGVGVGWGGGFAGINKSATNYHAFRVLLCTCIAFKREMELISSILQIPNNAPGRWPCL
jgi:hypothetical protein